MEKIQYNAFVVREIDGTFQQSIETCSTDMLPKGDVLIRVHYSSINYKDALSATGNKGVTKAYPHTPGIDAAGIVEFSENEDYKIGDQVIVTGNDLGMNTAGGFGQYIRVPADWVIKLPEGLTLKEAMIIGTAGLTSGISVSKILALVKPSDGKVLVSGATGGVGSVAIMLLSKLGYETVAVSGKSAESDFLYKLGATEIISREEFQKVEARPLLSAQFAGAIDTVGGTTLENILKKLKQFGAVTTCGSVSGTQLNTSVFPFILRGVTLMGISAQNYPKEARVDVWNKLAKEWKITSLLEIYNEITLDEVGSTIQSILKGQLKGRTIIKMID